MTDTLRGTAELIAANYHELGELADFRELKAGDTNRSYLAVFDGGDGARTWYVRRYNPSRTEAEIRYEHAFAVYFAERHGDAVASPVPVRARDGRTWIFAETEGKGHFYAVFTTVSGREPYSWEFNAMPEAAKEACAEITARFHAWACGFRAPEETERGREPFSKQMEVWERDIEEAVAKKREDAVFRRFNDYFRRELPFFRDTIRYLAEKLGDVRLPECVSHRDMNPGNLMFDDRDRVCAVFDLDWAATDVRLYDVGWMCFQITCSTDTDSWGRVPVAEVRRFADRYDAAMKELQSPPGPLSGEERELLPVVMIFGAMKVVMDFICYEDHTADPDRMFLNTWRFMAGIHDLRNQLDEMGER